MEFSNSQNLSAADVEVLYAQYVELYNIVCHIDESVYVAIRSDALRRKLYNRRQRAKEFIEDHKITTKLMEE